MKSFFGRAEPQQISEIIVVSGLPRSGTSLMMRILDTGGVPVLTDGLRKPDTNNPRGFYELEEVKELPQGRTSWLKQAEGKAVKIVSLLLRHLPPDRQYRVLFMERELREVVASQAKMLNRLGETSKQSDEETLVDYYNRHLKEIGDWLARQPHFEVCRVSFGELVGNPSQELVKVRDFLKRPFDVEAGAKVIEPALYRVRLQSLGGE